MRLISSELQDDKVHLGLLARCNTRDSTCMSLLQHLGGVWVAVVNSLTCGWAHRGKEVGVRGVD
jgi:hypothetical protein